MFCVIQEVQRKKPDPYGEHKEIVPYPLEMHINGVEQVPKWCWKWSEERYERPHPEAYKITLHQSYREGGAVRKRQYPIRTMSYYVLSNGACTTARTAAYKPPRTIWAWTPPSCMRSLRPSRKRLEAEFHQSPEYIAKQEHERIIADHLTAQNKFCSKYDVEKDEYNRRYDVFGVLRNKEYLEQIKAQHKARKESERRYRESWGNTYERYTSGSYSVPSVSTYSEDERAILKKFYRSLSKTYHPDLNPNEDTIVE